MSFLQKKKINEHAFPLTHALPRVGCPPRTRWLVSLPTTSPGVNGPGGCPGTWVPLPVLVWAEPPGWLPVRLNLHNPNSLRSSPVPSDSSRLIPPNKYALFCFSSEPSPTLLPWFLKEILPSSSTWASQASMTVLTLRVQPCPLHPVFHGAHFSVVSLRPFSLPPQALALPFLHFSFFPCKTHMPIQGQLYSPLKASQTTAIPLLSQICTPQTPPRTPISLNDDSLGSEIRLHCLTTPRPQKVHNTSSAGEKSFFQNKLVNKDPRVFFPERRIKGFVWRFFFI